MTREEQFSIDQEYIGIGDPTERNIKIFHDYKQTHSYEDYAKLVRDEHFPDAEIRPLRFYNDYMSDETQVYYEGSVVGEILTHNDKLEFRSYEGIGDDRYPVIDLTVPIMTPKEEVVNRYQQFDKYVLDGDYLLDKSTMIDELYIQMVRDSHGVLT